MFILFHKPLWCHHYGFMCKMGRQRTWKIDSLWKFVKMWTHLPHKKMFKKSNHEMLHSKRQADTTIWWKMLEDSCNGRSTGGKQLSHRSDSHMIILIRPLSTVVPLNKFEKTLCSIFLLSLHLITWIAWASQKTGKMAGVYTRHIHKSKEKKFHPNKLVCKKGIWTREQC